MNTPKLTIIIPTRNRANYLFWSVKTCLDSRYPNLEILICDNQSNDETEKVIFDFADNRIRYFRTKDFLSMTANWEYALSMVDEGFVTILGDDDGFIEGKLELAMNLLIEHQVDAISWKQSYYRWPGNSMGMMKDIYYFPAGKGYELRNSKEYFNRVINFELIHGNLPWLYAGIVHIRNIREVQQKGNGKFFNSKIPDVYSSLALSQVVDHYLYSYEPFSVAGSSAKSNGALTLAKTKEGEEGRKLFESGKGQIEFNKKLIYFYSFYLLIWESYYQLIESGIKVQDQNFSERKACKKIINELCKINNYQDSLPKLKKIIDQNKITGVNIPNRFMAYLKHLYFRYKDVIYTLSHGILIDSRSADLTNIYLVVKQNVKVGNVFFNLFANLKLVILKNYQQIRNNDRTKIMEY